MDTSPLDKLLEEAMAVAVQDFPEAKRKLDAFIEAAKYLFEKDENGNLTRRAHDSRHRLRSAVLDMRSYSRAKREVGRQRDKAKQKAANLITEMLAAYVVYRQWQLEYELLSDKDDATNQVPKSREDHSRDSKMKQAEPFIDGLLERGVTVSELGRRRQFELDTMALLFNWSHSDPRFENSDNPWLRLPDQGLLEAFRKGLDEDQARLVDLAMGLRDERAAELMEKARELLPENMIMGSDFAIGAARLMNRARDLSDGEAAAYMEAQNVVRDADIDALAKVMGMDAQSDRDKLQVIYAYVRKHGWDEPYGLSPLIRTEIVRGIFDKADIEHGDPDVWVEEVMNELVRVAQTFKEGTTGQDAYFAILRAGMQKSSSYDHMQRLGFGSGLTGSRSTSLLNLENSVEAGVDFKFDELGNHIGSYEEGYEEIGGPVYRCIKIPEEQTVSDRVDLDDEIADRDLLAFDAAREFPEHDVLSEGVEDQAEQLDETVDLFSRPSAEAAAEGTEFSDHDAPEMSGPLVEDIDGARAPEGEQSATADQVHRDQPASRSDGNSNRSIEGFSRESGRLHKPKDPSKNAEENTAQVAKPASDNGLPDDDGDRPDEELKKAAGDTAKRLPVVRPVRMPSTPLTDIDDEDMI